MTRTALTASAALIALAVVASVYGWIVLPDGEPVAVHWSASGEVNRYAPKGEALTVMPLIMVGLTALMAVLPRIEPRKANLRRSSKLYIVSWVGALALLLAAHIFTLYAALYAGTPSVGPILVGVALLLGAIGNYMTKSRSNWFLGVRTPWSLSSEAAWNASNRVSGWGFVATAAVTLLALIRGPELASTLMLLGVGLSAAAGIWVSFAVWRRTGRP